jgi:hypothetical protein
MESEMGRVAADVLNVQSLRVGVLAPTKQSPGGCLRIHKTNLLEFASGKNPRNDYINIKNLKPVNHIS